MVLKSLGQSGLNYSRLPKAAGAQTTARSGGSATQTKVADPQVKSADPGKATKYLGKECCSGKPKGWIGQAFGILV